MGRNIRALSALLSGYGLTGITLDLACGAVLALAAMAIAPLIGFLSGRAEAAAYRGIAGAAGHKAAFFIVNYVTFPGVVAHELAHAIGARLSGARVTEMCLFRPEGQTLGHVSIECRGRRGQAAVQLAASACAPVISGLILVPLAFGLAVRFRGHLAAGLFLYHFAASVICHMGMSGQDLRSYARGCLGLFPWFLAAGFVASYMSRMGTI